MKMMKKALFVMLTVAIVACVFAFSASAETTTGTYGALSYSITDGEVTITACDKTATDVEIPETIEGYPIIKIADYAFYGCSKLTQLTINARNFTVGNYAFWGCGSDTEGMNVIFGDSVELIPDRIMSSNEDSQIQSVNIKSLSIGKNVKSIGNNAFSECINLSSVSMSCDLETIGNKAFFCCRSLKSIDIPDSVITIGNSAFFDCDGLTSITIPDNVTTIGISAFCQCYNLSKVYWNAENVIYCDPNVFTYAGGQCGGFDLVFGDNVTDIPTSINLSEEYGYGVRTYVKSVYIGSSVKSIGARTFNNCDYLEKVEFAPNCEIQSIGDSAFASCSKLISITIPDSVVTLDSAIFSDCINLSSVTIGNSVNKISDRTFSNCTSLKSINIPNSVVSIGNEAFYYCSNLTSVTMTDSVEAIGNYAFVYCSMLQSINLSDNLASVGMDAFQCCSSLTNVTIPDSVTTIGVGAFSNCDNLENVTLGDSVEMIGSAAFNDCTSLKNIIIPESTTYIGDRAFSNCDNLANVTLGDSVEMIGATAFSDCTSLKNIIIPESTTYIGDSAFNNTALEKIVINGKKCVIEYNANTIPADAVIYGHMNSPAQIYAQMYGRDFVPLAAAECEHFYGEWIIDADATCTQRGFSHRVCTLCNGIEFEVIDETGHTDDDGDEICDLCDEFVSLQIPDIDDGDSDETQTSSIVLFLNSIIEALNKIVAFIKSIFGIA